MTGRVSLENLDFVVRFSESETLKRPGGVAQLGEHLPCKQGVKSSNLFISTMGDDSSENRLRAHSSAG